MIVFLNPLAGAGQGAQRWKIVRDALSYEIIPQDAQEVTCPPQEMAHWLRSVAESGDGRVVACGGDGTIYEVLQHIMQLPRPLRNKIILGAVGAGSSNDFHKWSVNGKVTCCGLPVRLSWNDVLRYNVGQVDYMDETGRPQQKFFIISASIGIIASANWRFSNAQGLLKWLKRHWLNAAILLAGLRALFTEKNQSADIVCGDVKSCESITSLSILISPHISGSFIVDFDVSPTSNHLGIALCENMRWWRRLRTFISLARGKFVGLPHTMHGHIEQICIRAPKCVYLEMDGDVVLARDIHITLLREAVNVCSR
jgi:diacylglycerol kinase (ATP)